MLITDYVSKLYSDDGYKQFICESCLLFFNDLISREELAMRYKAVSIQIKKQ